MDCLVLGNIGATGDDGVSINIGAGEGLWLNIDAPKADGGHVQSTRTYRDEDNVPLQQTAIRTDRVGQVERTAADYGPGRGRDVLILLDGEVVATLLDHDFPWDYEVDGHGELQLVLVHRSGDHGLHRLHWCDLDHHAPRRPAGRWRQRPSASGHPGPAELDLPDRRLPGRRSRGRRVRHQRHWSARLWRQGPRDDRPSPRSLRRKPVRLHDQSARRGWRRGRCGPRNRRRRRRGCLSRRDARHARGDPLFHRPGDPRRER